MNRTVDLGAAELRGAWPEKIPGVRLELHQPDGKAVIVDPLAADGDPRQEKNRARIVRGGFSLPPGREEVSVEDVPTFIWWMSRAVSGGHAKLVGGKFPDVSGAKVRTRFYTEEQKDPRDRTLHTLVALLLASLPADKRAAAEKVISELSGE